MAKRPVSAKDSHFRRRRLLRACRCLRAERVAKQIDRRDERAGNVFATKETCRA